MASLTPADRDARRVPVRALTVLYDADCPLCVHLCDWLVRQRQMVPLDLVPAGSEEARRRFPALDHAATFEEITVVGDAGQVYRGASAWIVTLWALRAHRPLAHRLASPGGAALARGAVIAAAKWRSRTRLSPGTGTGTGTGGEPGGQPWGAAVRAPAAAGGGYAAWAPAGGAARDAGWSYDPRAGWVYDAPGCHGGGATCAPR
ncbi:DCC1-like thiol-disulfide oxidoreductase family protein [Streptomyces sp. NPDC008150]|uniref:thiol-disulfide oxidoreductase DCC family protein n=1 Tax=Streptomyces sp. NPDC008150 TaxID=3364816 RepID=UPI0036EB2B92